MKNRLLTILVAVLVLLNVGNFLYGYSNAQQTQSLTGVVGELPKKPVVYVGQNGYTPKKGIDYTDGSNGHDGINAISFNTTVIKDVPLIGEQGIAGKDGVNGKDAPIQEIRVNQATGDIETKMSDSWFWSTLVPCTDYRLTCPTQGAE